MSEALIDERGHFRENPEWVQPKELVPHVAMFSGMNQEEYLGIVQYWETTGKPSLFFISTIINSTDAPRRASGCRIPREL